MWHFFARAAAFRWNQNCGRVWVENVMLASAPPSRSVRYCCLDMLTLAWGRSGSMTESAILLEIWDTGGLLQTDAAVQEGSAVALSSPQAVLRGRIRSCVKDDYGYLLEFVVNSGTTWFPESYCPPYLIPKASAQEED